MADTITPFGNHADDTSPFTEAPDDFPHSPADDNYYGPFCPHCMTIEDESGYCLCDSAMHHEAA
jgi:hypothetical protein